MIRNATIDDVAAICNIYNHYVLNTTVTFEEEAVSPIQMVKRIGDVQSKYPWLVYESEGSIIGYAYANAWKPRAAYRHTVEVSVYLDPAHTGKGLGKEIYAALIKRLEPLNIHTAIGGVALPNEASVRLHEALGFREMGYFKEVGFKFGKWVDVAYWDLLLPAKKNMHTGNLREEAKQHAENYY